MKASEIGDHLLRHQRDETPHPALPGNVVGETRRLCVWYAAQEFHRNPKHDRDMKGLVGEYTRPAEVIVDGEIGHVPALSGYETFDLDGTPFEAFVTADGSSGLAAATAGKVRNACFKTIRHPGHLDYMLFLLDDLGLRSRLDTLTNLLTNGLPQVADDMVVIHIGARGRKAGKKHQEVVVRRIHSTPASGRDPGCGALARGAAAHAAALLDALRTGHPADVAAKAPADRFLASVLES